MPFVDITAAAPGGSQIVMLSGLAALPQPSFATTLAYPAQDDTFNVGLDPTPNDIYTDPSAAGKAFVMRQIETSVGVDSGSNALALIVEVADTDAPRVNLYAGIDYNGDGVPSSAEQTCESSSASGAPVRCVVDLRGVPPTSVWFLVEVPQGTSGATYHVHTTSAQVASHYVIGFDETPLQTFFAVGPGHTAENQAFPLRLYWTDPLQSGNPLTPGRYYSVVSIGASANSGSAGILPVAITRVAGNDDAAAPFASGDDRVRVIENGETLAHQFIDVSGAGTLTVQSSLLGDEQGSVDFYAVRADFPASSVSASVDAAPAAGASSVHWTISRSGISSVSQSIPVTAGRWYIVASAKGDRAEIDLRTTLALTSATAPSQPGSYYNPQRSGHGIFISQAGGQQALYWYTYLEDGTAAWYVAQDNAPAAGASAWTTALRRVTWDGSAVDGLPPVGDVTVTPIDGDNLMFSWHLFGVAGSERFVVLARNSCVTVGGQSVGLAGQWYAPTQPGYGMDVVAEPQLQFDAFYLYDALGQPRWLIASDGPFAPTMSVELDQVSGFCPTCAYVPRTLQPVGTLNVSYSDASTGAFSTTVNLVAPLSGSFNVNRPIARLTGASSCSP